LVKELYILNLALLKTLAKKKTLVVYSAKKASIKVLKAKEPITASKEPSKTPIKLPKKAVVVKEVKEVVIC
jgi:hypothetical protein